MKKAARASSKAIHPHASVRSARRAADSFQNFEARIGYGTGNVADGGQYSIDYVSRNRWRLEAMYRSSWICGKAIDTIAEDMTKRGIEIKSSMPPDHTEQLDAYWKELTLWDKLCDTIKWGRLYGGAIAVLLIDGQNFQTPFRPDTVKADQFKGLLVLDRWQIQPTLNQLVKDFGPDLGMPEYYDVVADRMGMPRARIHYSRCIRIDGQDLPYWQRIAENLWGQSVLERLFDRLLAFDSTTQGAAQLVYKAHLRTYKVEDLRDIIAAGGPILEGLTKQIDFIRQTQMNEGMTLMDSKDEFEATTYSFSGLDTVLLQFSQQLSGALDIPLTKLFGQSPAGLNSTGESDLRNYYDGIEQQQERRLRNGVRTLLEVTYRSKFGAALPAGTNFAFRPLWQLTDIEKANVAAANTTTINTAFTSSLIGKKTALLELRQQSRLTNVWTNIPDAVIDAASDEVEPPGETMRPGPFDETEDEAGDAFSLGEDNRKTKLKTQDDEWDARDHPRDPEGKFTFAQMLAETNREIEFHEKRASFVGMDLAKTEGRIANAKARGIPHQGLERNANEMRATIAKHQTAIETLKRHAALFAQPAKQIHFAAEMQVGPSESSHRLHRQVVAEVHQQFPELAEDLQKNGYIKKLLVGEEPFVQDGFDRSNPNANGLTDSAEGRVYLRRHGATKDPGDRSPLWESPSVRYFQSEPEQAALALFLHEAAHMYYFNDPDVAGDSNPKLRSLFAKAKGGDRAITGRAAENLREYFAESFAAAHLDPAALDKRDPEMGQFIEKLLARRGMGKP